MVKRHYGGDPYNSRVDIEYVGGKPKVAFTFPNKRLQVRGSMLRYIQSFFYIIILIFLMYMLPFFSFVSSLGDKANIEYISFIRTIFLLIVMLYFMPYIIFFPFRKSLWDKVFPKFMAFRARFFEGQKEMVFTTKTLEGDGFVARVPLFSNILLDYEATGDFSDKLHKIKVEEYKFSYFKKQNKKKKKKPQKINEWLWWAEFYFSRKPKNGKLVVRFI